MITEFIAEMAVSVISTTGYFGIFVLTLIESVFPPMPSEAILPFAGFLIAEGKLSLLLVILVSTFGTILGSTFFYYLGKKGGRKILIKFGKYFFIGEKEIAQNDAFFKKHGELTVFFGRFVPGIRHLISIPAGIAQMPLKRFLFYSTLGAAIWNIILIFVGIVLKENWEEIKKYTIITDTIIVVAIILIIVYFGVKYFKKRKN